MPADIHVLPIDDLRRHVENRACWCGPTVMIEDVEGTAVEGGKDDPVVVVHHSLDGRELIEEHGVN